MPKKSLAKGENYSLFEEDDTLTVEITRPVRSNARYHSQKGFQHLVAEITKRQWNGNIKVVEYKNQWIVTYTKLEVEKDGKEEDSS